MALHSEPTGTGSLIVRDGQETVCEIRDLHLMNVRFRPQGPYLIGADVPLPLFWQQYANHEHPERNTGSSASVQVVKESGEDITVECKGTTLSGGVMSQYTLTITRLTDPTTYAFEVSAHLRIAGNTPWLVTPNLQHGEVEFCNLWPAGIFSPDAGTPLRSGACYVIRPQGVVKIPHHHLESMDKRNITLLPGDRLAWLLDEDTLCIEIVDAAPVTAGICAYMWDAHLAYKICTAETDVVLSGEREFRAHFRLFTVPRDEARHIASRAEDVRGEELLNTPILVDGVHSFADTLSSSTGDPAQIWPWETELVEGDGKTVRFVVDRSVGFDDNNAVRIDALEHATARWKATAFGSAFRKNPLPGNVRFRVVAYVNSRLTEGSAGIGIRLHRTGAPGLYDPAQYETYTSARRVEGHSGWIRLELTTDLISPAPDRLHVLLEVSGKGTCWFDNVHLTSVP